MLLMGFIQECEIRYGDKIILPVGRGDFEAEVMPVSCSVMSNSCRPLDYSPPGSSAQGIFLTQGSNPDLLHCRQILYRPSHQGSRI